MRIDGILAERRPVFSFEFFPPKTDEGLANLRETLAVLSNDAPDFVSVTYGALGATRDTTIDIVKWIKQDLGIEAMAHFTCVGATKEHLKDAPRERRSVRRAAWRASRAGRRAGRRGSRGSPGSG